MVISYKGKLESRNALPMYPDVKLPMFPDVNPGLRSFGTGGTRKNPGLRRLEDGFGIQEYFGYAAGWLNFEVQPRRLCHPVLLKSVTGYILDIPG